MVHDFEVAAELRVLVLQRVEAVRAGRDYLLDVVTLQRLDVLLRLALEQVLVTDSPRRVAAARLLVAEDAYLDARCVQHSGQSEGALHAALLEGGRAADPEEELRVAVVGDVLDLEALRPVGPRGRSALPGVSPVLDGAQRGHQRRRDVALFEDEVATQLDDLLHGLDEDGAGLLAGAAGRAGPQLVLADDAAGQQRHLFLRWRLAIAFAAEERRAPAAPCAPSAPGLPSSAKAAFPSCWPGRPPGSGRSACRRRGRSGPSTSGPGASTLPGRRRSLPLSQSA